VQCKGTSVAPDRRSIVGANELLTAFNVFLPAAQRLDGEVDGGDERSLAEIDLAFHSVIESGPFCRQDHLDFERAFACERLLSHQTFYLLLRCHADLLEELPQRHVELVVFHCNLQCCLARQSGKHRAVCDPNPHPPRAAAASLATLLGAPRLSMLAKAVGVHYF
jgi:hypothetical protein